MTSPEYPLDVHAIRQQFPLLGRKVHGEKTLVYLDSAATTPKPQAVIDAVNRHYSLGTANVHRAAHELSEEATEAYEGARRSVSQFINASSSNEIIFTRSATEAVNLVANAWGPANLKPGDEILVTEMEHHANIVPWQLLESRLGVSLKFIPMNDHGVLEMDAFQSLLTDRTRLVAATWISNALGTVNPIEDIVSIAREAGAATLVDATQALPHRPVDVTGLGADFIVFSGHKMYAPTGIGCLWGREQLLEEMPPWQGGGDMIETVSFEKTTYNRLPWKFEAGTPHIAGAIGLGAAVNWLTDLGMANIATQESMLLGELAGTLSAIERVTLVGDPEHRAAAISFMVEGMHPHDVGAMLDKHGIAVRTGHHCAQPTMQHFKVPATVRASLGVFNNQSDIEALDKALRRVIEVFG
ncbi:MAG: cysteine desulfurase CsdA [Phycisphaerae bacterium]|nr:cysteine desulfurase CsdA [Phycisphaerae bacterium]